jgi:AcrR family transcriptional regulator
MGSDLLNTKSKIYSTAEKLFSLNGFSATSMRDIALNVGIEAASLYNHINSKEEILENICFRMADKFLYSLDEVNDIYFNAEEKLKMAVKLHVLNITDNLPAASVFVREWRYLSKPKLNNFIKLRHKYEDGFKTILRQGEDENIFESVDRKFAVLTILSALNWIVEWYKPDGDMTPDQISEHLSDFILKGLKKKSF